MIEKLKDMTTRFFKQISQGCICCGIAVIGLLSSCSDDFLAEKRNYDNVNDVTIDKLVVVPLSNRSLYLSQPDALARVQIDAQALCEAAAAACGAPSPQSAETYVPPSRETHEWTAKCSSVVLVYRLHPTSKFTDW